MNKTLTKFFDDLKRIRFPQEERAHLRENIVSYMRTHPPLQERERQSRAHTLNIFTIFALLLQKPALVALSLVLILSLGTGISYAAGKTLPGDALYFVKVKINEEVPKLFFSPEEKAQWEVQRAARRIQEATDLALAGRLTEETASEVQKQLARHTENITEITNALTTQGEVKTVANIHTELQAALSANEAIFIAVADEQDIADEKTETVVAAIELSEEVSKNETTNAVIALVSNTQMQQPSLPQIAEDTKTETEQTTAAVAQTIESAPAESPVAQKFEAAQTIQEEGERRLREGAMKESVALFQEAKTRAGEVNALVERSKKHPRVARALREQKAKVVDTPIALLPPSPLAEESAATTQAIPAIETPTVPAEPQPSITPEQTPSPLPPVIQETPVSVAPPEETPKTQAVPEPAQPQPGGIAIPQETHVNTPPKIISYPSVQTGVPQNEIPFDWEAFDPDGDILRWEVWWGDRSGREFQAICESRACTRARASHVWEKSGSYTVRVRVSDGIGGFDSYSFVVTIQR